MLWFVVAVDYVFAVSFAAEAARSADKIVVCGGLVFAMGALACAIIAAVKAVGP